ncbi:tetratricopeptide repeat protein, partial [Tenacibaculum sp. Cn5-34]
MDSLNLINKNHTNALYNLGLLNHKKKQYNKAIEFYKKAIISNAYPLKVAQSYCKLGECFFRKGDFYKSVDYYLKGLPLIEKYGTNRSMLIQCIRLSNNCNKMDSKEGTDIGIHYLKKADSIIKNTPNYTVPSNIKYPLYNSFANLYSLKHKYNFKKAKYYYLYNLKNALIENDSITIANTYLNIGELYLNKNKDSSLYFLKKSLIYDAFLKLDYSETYRNIANFYKKKKLFKKALKNINNSIKYNFNIEKIEDIYTLSTQKYINTKDKRSIIQALKSKIEILVLLYNTTKKKTFLNKTIQTVRLANKITTILINYNTESETKFLWRLEVSKIFDLGINAAFLLNKPSIMFEFIEKNKAFLLTTEINRNLKNLKLPLEITSRDLTFKKNILKLESNKTNNQIKDSLFNLK